MKLLDTHQAGATMEDEPTEEVKQHEIGVRVLGMK